MKGFGSRERNGLIVFLCLVTVLLAICPVADRCGCTRNYTLPQADEAANSAILMDSAVLHGDSIFPAHRNDSSRRARKHAKKRVPRHQKADPQRRNFLDEPL